MQTVAHHTRMVMSAAVRCKTINAKCWKKMFNLRAGLLEQPEPKSALFIKGTVT